jgi:AraC-like DNA-binding protein
MKYLFILTTAFSFLFFLLLISKKKKRQEHWFLASIFFLITINSLFVFTFANGGPDFYVAIFSEVNYAIPLIYGTLFWFYTKSIVKPNFRFGKKDLWHFIPFIVFLSIILLPVFTDTILPDSKLVGYPLSKLIINPIYLFAILILLNRYRKQMLNELSYTDKINLMWLDWITVGAILLWVIALLGYIFSLNNVLAKPLLTDYLVLSFLGLYMFALAYVAFTKTDLFKRDNIRYVRFEEDLEEKKQSEKNEKVQEDEKALSGIMISLNNYLDEEKPFLDSQLTIYKLAQLTGIPKYKISKAINVEKGKNFFEYINGFRVNHVIEKIQAGELKELSLLGIATDSGFNSKASFNRIFKKVVGKTPSQFAKENNKL